MEYFKGFENLSKEFRGRIPSKYNQLLQDFGKLGFQYKEKEECFCFKRNNTLKGKWKIYFKDSKLNEGFVLYFKMGKALEYKIGEFSTIEELKEILITKKTKEIIIKELTCQTVNS